MRYYTSLILKGLQSSWFIKFEVIITWPLYRNFKHSNFDDPQLFNTLINLKSKNQRVLFSEQYAKRISNKIAKPIIMTESRVKNVSGVLNFFIESRIDGHRIQHFMQMTHESYLSTLLNS